jgi:hypothetical protein
LEEIDRGYTDVDRYTDRQQGHLIYLLSFFLNNKSRLIITITTITTTIIERKLATVTNIPSPCSRLTTEMVLINFI